MNPEDSANKKVKTLLESISPVDLNNKPTDFFFKYKNLTRIILSYLDTKDLHLMSRCSKYLFFEIHDKQGKLFREQFFILLKKKILLVADDVDHKNYKKLASIVSMLLSPIKTVFSSLLQANLVDELETAQKLSVGKKILLPPNEYKPPFSVTKPILLIGLDYPREEDQQTQPKKGAVLQGIFLLNANAKFENICFEIISPLPDEEILTDRTSIVANNCNPIFEDCQFIGRCNSIFLTNNGAIFMRTTFTNKLGFATVIYDSPKKVVYENCKFIDCKCGVNASESYSIYVNKTTFESCVTGVEFMETLMSDKIIEISESSFNKCDEAIYTTGGTSKFIGNIFTNNKIGVSKKTPGSLILRNNTFKDNIVGLKLRVHLPSIENENTFVNNKSDISCNKLEMTVELESKYQGIDKELFECLEKGICTYSETRSHYSQQEGYICDTCNLGEYAMICTNCAKNCHQGHNIHFEKISLGFCDCIDLCKFCKFTEYK